MGTKGWIIFAVLVVGALGGLVYMSQTNKSDVSEVDGSKVLTASEESGNIADHVRGNKDSKNVFVEYADFQCPHCAEAQPHVDKLIEKHGDEFAFVFRDFPVAGMFPNAKAAASAAEAAGKQGKFWEMHEQLFATQNEWGDAEAGEREGVFTGYAKELGLDEKKFSDDYKSDGVRKKIEFNASVGSAAGVTGTPSFFFNGEKMPEDVAGEMLADNFDKVREWFDQHSR